MKVTICIGSSCHLKGSRTIVEKLQDLINDNNLLDKVEMSGAFCMGKCQQGVNVVVDGDFYSVSPSTVDTFFKDVILARVNNI